MPLLSRALVATASGLALVGLSLQAPSAVGSPAAATAAAQQAASRYRATIRTTAHGIPHITAETWGSLGFGSGYAAAGSSICTLADTFVTGRGERSRYFGADHRYNDGTAIDASNLEVDAFVTDLRDRHVVEGLLADPLAGPGKQARRMVRGYAAGINSWEKAHQVTDPACKGAAYLDQPVTPLDIWYGIYIANLNASDAQFVSSIVNAAPPAPGVTPKALPTRPGAVDRSALLKGLGRDRGPAFGSNATAVGGRDTTTGKGMLLGNPHFPWVGRYRFTQQQLTIPGKYDVAGASLIGSPVVNIGWNKNVAWSHTVSTAFRFTPYEYPYLGGLSYATDHGTQTLMHDVVSIAARQKDGSIKQIPEDLYRTPQGFVINAPSVLMPWSPTSFWAIRDANAEQLRTIDTFLNMGKAHDVRDLLRRQDAGGGMPWVNTTAADRDGRVLYADHSVVPHVSNAEVARCLTTTGRLLNIVAGLPGLDGTRADSSCKWGTDAGAERPGIFGPHHLPAVVRRDWVTNANDSYWLPNPKSPIEGYASIIGCERCQRTMRTRMVDAYVMDRLAGRDGLAKGDLESPRTLRATEFENRVRAGEVMRAGGALDRACARTGKKRACRILAAWDGHSNKGSVGYQIFDAFAARVPTTGVWKVPFDYRHPLSTPRGLIARAPAVVTAMSDAIAALHQAGVPLDARWGSLQVAGDRGAPPIPLGGGSGDSAGNANALASRDAPANKRFYRPVNYGSSHIQAVAFLPGGRVSVHSILTYGQSEDPTSPYSSDQTRMFSDKRWVHFAWTRAEIHRRLIDVEVVHGG
ncbi:penicillin acylase family protein [Nocardioides cynanchi]|uniref:penicillin acylase family protein n=1 Tax=Nocardioides cynanchi TaxID=2558918 RepID=UPI001EE35297|nr:penicillin acylase family protein [Nocardioides cynanchi]